MQWLQWSIMGRRKKGFHLPFLKIRINSRTLATIIGSMFVVIAVIIGLSFIYLISPQQNGRVLKELNMYLIQKFGGLSIFVPFIILLIAAHFFNTKKLKLIKWNVTVGTILIFIALLGFLRTGEWGTSIAQNLIYDFTPFGAFLILAFCLLTGVVLFLDTSIDMFVLFLANIVTGKHGYHIGKRVKN